MSAGDTEELTFIVTWSGVDDAYAATVEGRDSPRATGTSAEEALLNLKRLIADEKAIAAAWTE